MKTTILPHRILIVGASGPIGIGLIGNLVGKHDVRTDRIVLLERRDDQIGFSIVDSGNVEGISLQALVSWIAKEPDAVVYLAGVRAETALRNPALGRELHVSGFSRLLEAIATIHAAAAVVYASSTAIHGPPSTYGNQKAEAEAMLLASSVAGTCLRFPTVLPRASAMTRSAFLDDAVRRLCAGERFKWPIAANRRIRLMSAAMASRHIAASIGIGHAGGRRILDLPATIATPRDICDVLGSGDPEILIQEEVENAIASRSVDIDSCEAVKLGCPMAEALDELLTAANFQLRTS